MHWMLERCDFLNCEDFSYSEKGGYYCLTDRAEGESVKLSLVQFVEAIADDMLDQGEVVGTRAEQEAAALEILYKATTEGKAKFLYGLLG